MIVIDVCCFLLDAVDLEGSFVELGLLLVLERYQVRESVNGQSSDLRNSTLTFVEILGLLFNPFIVVSWSFGRRDEFADLHFWLITCEKLDGKGPRAPAATLGSRAKPSISWQE